MVCWNIVVWCHPADWLEHCGEVSPCWLAWNIVVSPCWLAGTLWWSVTLLAGWNIVVKLIFCRLVYWTMVVVLIYWYREDYQGSDKSSINESSLWSKHQQYPFHHYPFLTQVATNQNHYWKIDLNLEYFVFMSQKSCKNCILSIEIVSMSRLLTWRCNISTKANDNEIIKRLVKLINNLI